MISQYLSTPLPCERKKIEWLLFWCGWASSYAGKNGLCIVDIYIYMQIALFQMEEFENYVCNFICSWCFAILKSPPRHLKRADKLTFPNHLFYHWKDCWHQNKTTLFSETGSLNTKSNSRSSNRYSLELMWHIIATQVSNDRPLGEELGNSLSQTSGSICWYWLQIRG